MSAADVAAIQKELAKRELARRSYADYLAYTGGTSWTRSRFVDFLAGQVQKFVDTRSGNAYDILLIESPPQHGKSMAVSEALPSWCMGRHPDWRVIMASYNDESAQRFARRNKEKLRDFGKILFGVEIGAVERATEFEMKAGPGQIAGRLISRGMLAGITGNPANLLIIDDPIKNRQEADSPTQRRKIWNEWLNSLKTRLAAGAKVVVIMTPWHEDDFAGRLQDAEPGLQLLRLPVEAEDHDPLGRAPGEPLCPELGKDKKWLDQFKSTYLNDPEGGARAWSALYQCSPRTEEGTLVKRDWWRYCDPAAFQHCGAQILSVDASFKGGDDNDFVAIQSWCKRGNDYFCRDCLNQRLDFPGTLAAIRAMKTKWPATGAVVIEDKANGSAVISVLQREMFCVPVNPMGGKEARVNAVSAAIESGHVFLPKGAAWTEEFVDQFAAFPAGKHDDMVDSASQALSYLIWRSGESTAPAPQEDEPDEHWDPRNGDEYDVYG